MGLPLFWSEIFGGSSLSSNMCHNLREVSCRHADSFAIEQYQKAHARHWEGGCIETEKCHRAGASRHRRFPTSVRLWYVHHALTTFISTSHPELSFAHTSNLSFLFLHRFRMWLETRFFCYQLKASGNASIILSWSTGNGRTQRLFGSF